MSPGDNLCPLSEEYLHGDNCFQRNPINRVLLFVEERSSLKCLCVDLKGELNGAHYADGGGNCDGKRCLAVDRRRSCGTRDSVNRRGERTTQLGFVVR